MNSELKQAAQQVVDAFNVFSDADDFVSLFALTQKMRALREAIQQAEVTNEREAFESCTLMEGSLFKRRADDPDKYWDGNVQDDWELWKARATLTLRPEKVPMTDTELCEALGIDGSDAWTYQVRDVVEAHHGITAQAKKEAS